MPRALSVPEKREKVNILQKGGGEGGKCMVYTDKLTQNKGLVREEQKLQEKPVMQL